MDIFNSTFLITIIVSVLLGVVLIVVEYFVISPLSRIRIKKIETTQDAIRNAEINLVRDLLSDLPEPAKERYIQYLVATQNTDGSFPEAPIQISNIQIPEIDEKVQQEILPLKHRLGEIEKRFPDASTVDKIASVNDAILATKIEQLEVTLKRIEAKTLNRWNVAVVVLEVIVAVGTLVALVITAFQYYLN